MMMMIKRRRWQWWSWQFDLVAMEIACKIGIRVFDQNTGFSRSPNLKQDICSLRNHATLSIRFYKKTIRVYALFKRTCPQRSQSSVQPPASSSGIRQQDQRMSLEFVIICSSIQNTKFNNMTNACPWNLLLFVLDTKFNGKTNACPWNLSLFVSLYKIQQQDQRISLEFVFICSSIQNSTARPTHVLGICHYLFFSIQNSTTRTMHVLSLTIVRLKETQLTVTFIPPQVGGASDLVLRNLWSRAFYPKKYNWHNNWRWESQWEQLIVVDYLWGHGGNRDR